MVTRQIFRDRWKRIEQVIERTVSGYWTHGCVTHGAALAFYALFVLVPVPIFVVSGAAAVVGDDLARADVVEVLRELTGEQMAATLAEALDGASQLGEGRGAKLFGLVSLLFGATAFFVELQDTLNKIWDVSVEFDWKRFVRSRLFSFVMVAASGGILLALTLVGAVVRGYGARLAVALPWTAPALGVGGLLVAMLIIATMFSFVFRFVPEAEVTFREVWMGSFVTAILFVGGNELIGLYLRYTSLANVYGAAGSLVVTLVWIYYSASACLFGAELTRTLGAGAPERSA